MGLTERRWFENENCPEKVEWELEDAIYARRQDMVIRREEILSVLDAARMCNLIAKAPYLQLYKLIARLPEEVHCGMEQQLGWPSVIGYNVLFPEYTDCCAGYETK